MLSQAGDLLGFGINKHGGLGDLGRGQEIKKLEPIGLGEALRADESLKQIFATTDVSLLLTSEGRVLSSGLAAKGMLGRFDYQEMERVDGELCMFGFGGIPEVEVAQLSVGREIVFGRGNQHYYRWGTIQRGVDNGDPDSNYPK